MAHLRDRRSAEPLIFQLNLEKLRRGLFLIVLPDPRTVAFDASHTPCGSAGSLVREGYHPKPSRHCLRRLRLGRFGFQWDYVGRFHFFPLSTIPISVSTAVSTVQSNLFSPLE